MRVPRPNRTIVRAAIAVVALYALALQAVLGLALPTGAAGPAHILCLAQAVGDDGPAGQEQPGHHHALPCCIAAVSPAPLAALPPCGPVVWPARAALAVEWRRDTGTMPRAPPGSTTNARAPPVA